MTDSKQATDILANLFNGGLGNQLLKVVTIGLNEELSCDQGWEFAGTAGISNGNTYVVLKKININMNALQEALSI